MQEFSVKAKSVDEAKKIALKQIPPGHRIISSKILNHGGEVYLEDFDNSIDDAFARLEARAVKMNCPNILKKEVLVEPGEYRERVAGWTDYRRCNKPQRVYLKKMERQKVHNIYQSRLNKGEWIECIEEIQKYRNGFLGIGRRPTIYEVVIRNTNKVAISCQSDSAEVLIQYDRKQPVDYVKERDIKGLQTCLQKEGDIDKADQNGRTALMLAIKFNDQEMFELLLNNGADVDIVSPTGQTALSAVITEKQLPMIELLASKASEIVLTDYILGVLSEQKQLLEKIVDQLADSAAFLVPLLVKVARRSAPNDEDRFFLMSLIERISDPAAVPHLLAIVKSTDEAAYHAVVALGKIRDSSAVDELISCLDDDRNATNNLVDVAVESLGRIGDKRAVVPLITLVKNNTHNGLTQERLHSVILALWRIGIRDSSAVDELISCLDDDRNATNNLVDVAVESLGRIGDKRAVVPLITLVKNNTHNGLTQEQLHSVILALWRIGCSIVRKTIPSVQFDDKALPRSTNELAINQDKKRRSKIVDAIVNVIKSPYNISTFANLSITLHDADEISQIISVLRTEEDFGPAILSEH